LKDEFKLTILPELFMCEIAKNNNPITVSGFDSLFAREKNGQIFHFLRGKQNSKNKSNEIGKTIFL
jgi:hypothetical protein